MTAVYQLLVPRFLEQYDPFFALGFAYPGGPVTLRTRGRPPAPTLEDVELAQPLSFVDMDQRNREYHVGRIAWFVNLLRRDIYVDPIEVDNECHGMHILPQVVLLDGHHRLAAAALIDHPVLPMTYGGRADVLDWLTGRRDRVPEP